MLNRRNLAIITAFLALSACASPAVDTSAPMFDKTQYTADLDTCQGGSALNAALLGLEGAVIGSAIGAAEGAYHGALAGDAPEGAFIGAVVGSVVGVFVGAYEPFQEQEQSVRRCLSGKGYVLVSS